MLTNEPYCKVLPIYLFILMVVYNELHNCTLYMCLLFKQTDVHLKALRVKLLLCKN